MEDRPRGRPQRRRFVGANLLISQGRRNWARYRALAGGLLGAAGFGLLRGNRSVSTLVADSEFIFTRDEGEPFVVVDPAQIDAISKVAELRSGLAEYATGGFASLGTFEWPLVGLVLGLVAGYATGHTNRIIRLAVPTAVGAFAGWLIGTSLLFRNRPDASIVEIVLFAIVGAAVLAGISLLFGKRHVLVERAVRRSDRGHHRRLVAFRPRLRLWFHGDHRRRHPTCAARSAIRLAERPRREWARLVRPAVPCGDLPRPCAHLPIDQPGGAGGPHHPHLLPDRDSEEFVGLDNYEHLITSETFLDWRSWSGDDGTWNVLTSRLTWFGLFLIIAGIGIAYSINWTRNRTSASTTPRPLGPRWRSASSFWRSPSSR